MNVSNWRVDFEPIEPAYEVEGEGIDRNNNGVNQCRPTCLKVHGVEPPCCQQVAPCDVNTGLYDVTPDDAGQDRQQDTDPGKSHHGFSLSTERSVWIQRRVLLSAHVVSTGREVTSTRTSERHFDLLELRLVICIDDRLSGVASQKVKYLPPHSPASDDLQLIVCNWSPVDRL